MCRNIKLLFNFDPPATEEEIRNASLQFVRKISGFQKPSHVNEDAFNHAIDDMTKVSQKLLMSLHTSTPSHTREIEQQKAKERSLKRFAKN